MSADKDSAYTWLAEQHGDAERAFTAAGVFGDETTTPPRTLADRVRILERQRETLREALFEIVRRPCRGSNVDRTWPCPDVFPEGPPDRWCAACVAGAALRAVPQRA